MQPETWRWCRDCAELTSGHCWRHASWTLVIPAVTISTTYVIPDSSVTILPAIVIPQSLGDPYAGR